MTPELIGGLVDAGIPLLGGIFPTAYGLGFVGGDKTSATKARQALKAWGPFQMTYVDAADQHLVALRLAAADCP